MLFPDAWAGDCRWAAIWNTLTWWRSLARWRGGGSYDLSPLLASSQETGAAPYHPPVPLRLTPTFSVAARPLRRPLLADVLAGAQYSSLTQPQLRSEIPVFLFAFRKGVFTRRVVASYDFRYFLVSDYLSWDLVSISLVTIDSLINFCYES